MPIHSAIAARALAVLLAASLGAGAAWADKPEWAGGGKGRDGSHGQVKQRGDHGSRADHRGPRGDRNDQGERRRHADERRPRAERDDRGHRDHRDRRDARPPVVVLQPGHYFNDGQRRDARQWYGDQYRSGRCPPGLAKKHNGCLPPGQAKKWHVGQRLPPGVVYYAVPQPVVVQLGVPPAGYRYVRVAGDIVLLSIGSGIVVDAMVDLNFGF